MDEFTFYFKLLWLIMLKNEMLLPCWFLDTWQFLVRNPFQSGIDKWARSLKTV